MFCRYPVSLGWLLFSIYASVVGARNFS